MRTFSRTLLLFLLIIAVSAAAAGVHYALRGGTLAGLRQGGQELLETAQEKLAAAIPERSGAARAGAIRVYFTPREVPDADRMDTAFLEFLRSARQSIHGAFYDFQWTEAARVLVEKRQEGVEVALVCDADYSHREAVQACISAGIPVVFDERAALMHDKFCIVDGERVWTGSTNCTENCLFRNNNNSLLIASEELAANFAAEFGEMFVQKKFGKTSPSGTPHPTLIVDGFQIESYFAPEDNVYEEVESEIQDARQTIDFMAFSFTSKELADAMLARRRDGVRVRGLFDTGQAGSKYSQDEYLAKKGAEIRLDTHPHVMHHKVIIVDAATVITGSYNFSRSAEEKNDENLIVIHSPAIAREYLQEFQALCPN